MDVDKTILEGGGQQWSHRSTTTLVGEVIVGEQIECDEEGRQGLYFNNQQSW